MLQSERERERELNACVKLRCYVARSRKGLKERESSMTVRQLGVEQKQRNRRREHANGARFVSMRVLKGERFFFSFFLQCSLCSEIGKH